ncbi:uncharacterized protein si:dkey-86e18.1 isoform X1 [Amphiprion ocellaris]|uniref:Uncharacterized protein n=1 Tax=Amphiprion ocellaris TaxID=80972 RepID=A0AAQ5YTZ6_AMPOC|nr:uncharacterized protein si:dkey-86e18.1 isoform X1 [Amphiprion ocellaris]
MARNEEKQQGRLNRLWLQKEREDGRLKDVRERRPKLSTLNSASSVKKWIPSIKKEIEYYLQQSQLSHYPERKIAEFQLRIEALEKEYQSFITKLRLLDPSCKHKPWTPRAYLRKRGDTQECPTNDIKSRSSESHHGNSQCNDLASSGAGTLKSPDTEEPLSFSKTRFQTLVPTNLASETSESVCPVQDQPLAFDRTRLAIAAAAFRGPTVQISSSQTQRLARLLQSGLPNLGNSPLTQTFSSQNRDRENNDRATNDSAIQENKSDCDAADRIPGKSSNAEATEERTGHVLGLDCYSSSDEDCDA